MTNKTYKRDGVSQIHLGEMLLTFCTVNEVRILQLSGWCWLVRFPVEKKTFNIMESFFYCGNCILFCKKNKEYREHLLSLALVEI